MEEYSSSSLKEYITIMCTFHMQSNIFCGCVFKEWDIMTAH